MTNSAKAGGGERAIKRHTEVNKKIVVRERLKLLLDNENDFLEIGTLAGWNMDYGDIPAAGIVIGKKQSEKSSDIIQSAVVHC